MRREAERSCDQHPNQFDCPDCLIHYSSKFREYGLIIHDGGSSFVVIQFCPFCGSRLPMSLRDQWFKELEQRGIDPWEDKVPVEFEAEAWWKDDHI